MYDHHLNIKNCDTESLKSFKINIKIKKEEDHSMEMVISIRTLQGHQTHDKELCQYIPEAIGQED